MRQIIRAIIFRLIQGDVSWCTSSSWITTYTLSWPSRAAGQGVHLIKLSPTTVLDLICRLLFTSCGKNWCHLFPIFPLSFCKSHQRICTAIESHQRMCATIMLYYWVISILVVSNTLALFLFRCQSFSRSLMQGNICNIILSQQWANSIKKSNGGMFLLKLQSVKLQFCKYIVYA